MTKLEDLLPMLARLAAHRDERHSLADLARELGTSASTFQRAFSRLVGESPKQFTRRLALEAAALALITTDRSVLEIALDAGFESHEGFTRVFASHFGMPPRELRQRYTSLAASTDFAHDLGPCIGLFRVPLDLEEPTMTYDITRQSIPAATFLYRAGRCSHADIAKTLAQLFGGILPHVLKAGLELRSPPTTLYVAWGPGMVTMHAGVVVAGLVGDPPPTLLVDQLPAGDAAVTIHTGPYDSLGEAHAALEQWIAAQGFTSAGSPREVYLTDPGQVPDPAQWKTQLIWPLA